MFRNIFKIIKNYFFTPKVQTPEEYWNNKKNIRGNHGTTYR